MLQTLETCFTALFAHHRDAFTLYDCNGTVVAQNDASVRLRRISEWDAALEGTIAQAAFVEAYQGLHCAFELTLPSREGELHIRVDLAPVVLKDEVVGISAIARDIRFSFAYDYEGEGNDRLPSLAILHDRMSRLLIQMRREGRPFAVHVIALRSNVTLAGELESAIDNILIERLLQMVRGTDTVASIGSNYLVVQAEMLEADSVNSMVNRLVNVLESPITVGGGTHLLKAYVGSAIASRRTASVDDLLGEADVALARCKMPGCAIARNVEHSQNESDKA